MYVHLSWLIFLLALFATSSLLLFFTLCLNESVSLSLMLVSLNGWSLKLSFLFDWMSSSFMSVVLLISSIVMVYSYNYIAPYSNSSVFLWLTFLFVLSILVVVCTSSLFFLILGWDGLGLVSFFLIVYYQSQSAITSGLFTLLINRIGDCFFLVSLGLILSDSVNLASSNYPFIGSFLFTVLLLVTFITNSAIYPFSSWLPLAIAAPTPISALVHSSTLVTAGLYLIMRFSSLFSFYPPLISMLTVLSIFTSFYAGLNAVFEADLKNLIALSTLSHLGFIGLALFLGLNPLAFFHLLTHALFKSLLFMAMGDVITNLSHSQDIRYLSAGASQTPGSCFIMNVSLFNLLGLPSLSGFFSNDLVLETFHYTQSSLFLLLILVFNIGFTYFYTFQLLFFSFQSVNSSSYTLLHSPEMSLHPSLLSLLALSTLIYCKFFLSSLVTSTAYVPVTFMFNLLPTFLSISMLIVLYVCASQINLYSPLLWFYLSKIGGLSLVSLPVSSLVYFFSSLSVVRNLEQGLANHVANVYPSLVLTFSSYTLSRLVASSALTTVFYTLPFLLLFYL